MGMSHIVVEKLRVGLGKGLVLVGVVFGRGCLAGMVWFVVGGRVVVV